MEMLENSSTGPVYVDDSMNDEFMEELNADEEEFEFENERCGICSDVIIDRGLLDCCDHWFCFTCIDNWAAITNRCPLCKNEFQLITCLPVYDITGSIRIENSSTFRDDDWGIQGKNNALSFPSYYINEDAVTCLDGDECKVRSGLSTLADDLNLDTSIACDSCDLWYHAFCVGFNPECPSESSWLCPRCLSAGEQQEPDVNHSVLKGTDVGWSVDPSLSGNVSVSVADAGETALVVSMVQGDQRSKPNKVSSLESRLDMSRGKESENYNHRLHSAKLNAQVEKSGHSGLEYYSPIRSDDKKYDEISVKSQNNYAELLDISTEMCIVQQESEPGEKSSAPSVSVYTVSGIMTDDTCQNENEPSQVAHDDVSVLVSVDEVISRSSMNDDNGSIQEDTKFAELVSKHVDESSLFMMNVDYVSNLDTTNMEDSQLLTKLDCTAKKAKHDEKPQIVPSVSQVNASISSYSEICRKGKSATQENLDIMSIVRETDHKVDGQERINNLKGKLEKNDSSAGLRVKKIMRRVEDKKEMADLVQKLGKEIDESVQGKTFGRDEKDNTFEGKLLTAFREAIVNSKDEVTQKPDPSLLNLRKKLLQKGKVRENLTKKIYGTANGKRRRAWDRDWEVEFWKHRCSSNKREKIETLKSVLAHLKKASTSCIDSPETTHELEDGMGNSILSRIYLADASVFPRKNDIKPLSAIDQFSEVITEGTELLKEQPFSNSRGNLTEMQKVAINPVSLSSALKGRAQAIKGSADLSISAKTDKRKWALEVLARKNALTSSSAEKYNKQEDGDLLKGKFPLFAQLPSDMRPVLASIRHNKVPLSVRQAQLYRITEHYLRRTNLTAIRRTADTELAVVDAVNVEKELSERSSSKMVYLNLCAQFLSQAKPMVSSKSMENINHTVDDSNANMENEMDETADNSSSKPLSTLDSDAEEALRNAGLLSDSPPCSPVETMNEPKADAISSDEQRHVENVLETDNHPESDINTKFECNLEDKGSCSFSTSDASKVYETKPENGISEMKVPFSNIKSVKAESHNNGDDLMVEAPVDWCQHHVAVHKECTQIDIDLDGSSTPKPAKGDGLNKLCLSECEKWYGSEKELDGSSTSKTANKGNGLNKLCLSECEKLYGSEKEPLVVTKPSEAANEDACMNIETNVENKIEKKNLTSTPVASKFDTRSCSREKIAGDEAKCESSGGESSLTRSHASKDVSGDEQSKSSTKDTPDFTLTILKKVEAYVKEHIRPLCKSGVITVDQYRWAVGRTTEKVMVYHSKAKNANFLIKEGDKVKKLAEQYVEIAQQKGVL